MYYSLGVGAVSNGSYLIDVGTSPSGSRFQGNLRIDGTLNPNNTLNIGNNATIDGTLTVNNGKGVAYNSANSNNLRIHRFTTETATAILGPHGRSGEFQIAFNGGFTSNPTVLVGDIYSTGGTAGDLFMVDLVLYGCSTASGTTTCDARLVNKSAGSVNYSVRWNCVAIGY